MSVLTQEFLSGSPGNGRNIKIVATASPGTTIHTAHATAKDEIDLEAYNSDTVDRELVLQLGGTTSPDDDLKFTIPAKSGFVPLGKQLLSGSVVVKGYCATANVIIVRGQVARNT